MGFQHRNEITLKWIPPRATIAMAVLGGIAGTAIGVWNTRPSSSAPLPDSPLWIEKAALDLGDVSIHQDAAFTFAVCNQSDTDIQVDDLATSCTCTNLSPRTFLVPAHGEVRLSGTLSLRHQVGLDGPMAEPFSLSITAYPQNALPVRWDLHGRAMRDFSVRPERLDFSNENQVVRDVYSPTLRVLVTPYAGAHQFRAECNPDQGIVVLHHRKGNGNDDNTWGVDYTPRNDLPCGNIDHAFDLVCCDSDGQEICRTSIPVTGTVVRPVYVAPDSVVLTPLHDTVTLRLKWYGDSPWKIASVAGQPPCLEVVAKPLGKLDRLRFLSGFVLRQLLPKGY